MKCELFVVLKSSVSCEEIRHLFLIAVLYLKALLQAPLKFILFYNFTPKRSDWYIWHSKKFPSADFFFGGKYKFNSSPCTLVSFCRMEMIMFGYPPGTLVNAGSTLYLLRLKVLQKYWDVLKFLQKQISQDMNVLHALEQRLKLWYSITFWSRWEVISFKLSSMTSVLNESISEAESVCVHSIIMNC